MASTPFDLLLYLHKEDDGLLFLFSECDIIVRYDMILFTKALVRLILAFGVRLCGKKKGVFQDILSSQGVFKMKCF